METFHFRSGRIIMFYHKFITRCISGFNSKKQPENPHAALVDRMKSLQDGDVSALCSVYCVLANDEGTLIKTAATAIADSLSKYTTEKMIRLDERFRQRTSMEWAISWEKIDIAAKRKWIGKKDEWIYVLILGSYHPNGYFREKCLYELAKYENTLPYIVLRMNDWVEKIRVAATKIAVEKVQSCDLDELIETLPQIDRLSYSRRRQENAFIGLHTIVSEKIEKNIENSKIDLEKLSKLEIKTRKAIYKIIFSKKILGFKEADGLLQREVYSFYKGYIIECILKLYNCPMVQVDTYLSNKNKYVRYSALQYKYNIMHGSWDGIESFLLDSSRLVREFATFVVKKHADFDILKFYMEHLHDEFPDNAIIGMGENGDINCAEALKPFLNAQKEKTVKLTIRALGLILKNFGEKIYWEFLFDDRISISKAAFMAIRNNNIRFDAEKIYAALGCNHGEHIKGHLISILLAEKYWDRIPFLLYMYNEKDDFFRIRIRESIQKVIDCSSLYQKIYPKQVEIVRKSIEDNRSYLPVEVINAIEFNLKFVK